MISNRRYQSVTNWFQNQRSIAKKRKEDSEEPSAFPPAAAAHHLDHHARAASRTPSYGAFPPSSSVLHPSLSVPPASGHPSLSGLGYSLRIMRSPSVAPVIDSRASSPRPSPYSTTLTERSSSVNGRPRRSRPEPYQLEALKKLFHRTATPSIEERGALAMEINMDIGKVTNWFRNLRQTARRRSKRESEHEDDDDDMSASAYQDDYSRDVSRAVSPARSSSSDRDVNHMDIDQDLHGHMAIRVKLEDEQKERGSIYSHSLASNSRSSDMASEEDAQEAVTPSPASSPYPAFPQVNQKTASTPQPRQEITFALSPLPDLEKAAARISTTGVKVEDAMLLLSFHHHVVG